MNYEVNEPIIRTTINISYIFFLADGDGDMTRLIIGQNDLATLNPELAKQWDYSKNGSIKPENITSGSSKKIWWKCDKGHSFCATPSTRTRMNTGCPYCSNKKVLKGYNDLLTVEPELALDWDYENNDCNPDEVCAGTGKILGWKCHVCGGQWKAKGAEGD